MSRLALVAALAALAPLPIAFHAPEPFIAARPVPLDPADPGRRTLGALRFVGGWVLTSSDQRFGGISSMTLEDGQFTMLSDGGIVTKFRFVGSGRQPDFAMTELPDGPGDAPSKINRDSESSTYDPVSGHVWAGFETLNEIWRYTKGFAKADGHVKPPAMAGWPGNEGAEAMVRLRDGRFLVFAETADQPDGSHQVLLFPDDPVKGVKPFAFGWRGLHDFAPTDAAQLPDGRVLILNRRFSVTGGFAAAVTIMDPRDIKPGGVVIVKPIAQWAAPLTVDNMEALAIEQRGGKTILWLGSDDNYFALERTLLLEFELPADV